MIEHLAFEVADFFSELYPNGRCCIRCSNLVHDVLAMHGKWARTVPVRIAEDNPFGPDVTGDGRATGTGWTGHLVCLTRTELIDCTLSQYDPALGPVVIEVGAEKIKRFVEYDHFIGLDVGCTSLHYNRVKGIPPSAYRYPPVNRSYYTRQFLWRSPEFAPKKWQGAGEARPYDPVAARRAVMAAVAGMSAEAVESGMREWVPG